MTTTADRAAEAAMTTEMRMCETCEQAKPVAEVSAIINPRGYVAGWQCQDCDEKIAYAATCREA